MNISELKIKLLNKANALIDVYFSEYGLTEKFINSTLKIIMKQNIHKIDNIFELFADKNGDIDLNMLINEYSKMIPDEGIVFDIKEHINNELIKNMIPNKVLIIKKEDIMSIMM
jgi:hypothetical protein